MRVLGFEARGEIVNGRHVRSARFKKRSLLPLSAACVVANGVRETLSALLAAPVSLRLLEPALPDADAWNAIAAGAHVYGVRGPVCDAAFVLRPQDALAVAAGAFGEEADRSRAISTVEEQVLIRALRGVAGALAPVCGRELSPLERILDIRGYATYFELHLERPIAARLGVALSRDPGGRGAPGLRIEDLADLEVEVRVQFASGDLPGSGFLDLRPGANVPMKTRVGEPGLLKIGGAVLARGECGALGERNAILVTAVR